MTVIDEILKERGKNYGEFSDHAALAQALKDIMRSCAGWKRLSWSQKEALEMDAHKTARILNGDPSYLDSWVDKIGYIQLVVNELNSDKNS